MRALYNLFADKIETYFHIDARYFLSGGFWLSVGQVITTAVGLITTVLLVNYLSENNYGIYKYLISLTVIFSVFSLTGIGPSILQAAAKGYRNFYQENISLVFKFSLITSALAVGGSIYYFINENPTLAIGCLLIALTQPLTQSFQHAIPQLTGEQKFKEVTTVLTIRSTFVNLTTIVVLIYTNNILWLFFTYLFSQMLVNVATHFVYENTSGSTPIEITRSYLSYAKHTSVRNVIDGLASKADAIIVFTKLGAVELAVYSIATIIPEQIKASFKNLASLLMPKYSKLSDTDTLVKSLNIRSVQLLFLLLLISLVYIAAAPFIYEILFPKYVDVVFYSQLYALSLPTFVSIIPHTILKARLADSALHKINITGSIIQLTLVFLGAISMGVLGVILASVVRRYITMSLMFYFILSKTR